MRIRELLEDDSSSELAAQILTVLQFLRNRDHDKKLTAPHSTVGVINMINNITPGNTITYELLDSIRNSNSAIGELISNMDKTQLSLKPFGDEPGAPEEQEPQGSEGGNAKDPTNIVNAMAKKAASKRS